ncbi:MAG: hypothetical protein ACRETK_02370 [Steroidobacteraceae bacterium]
MRSTHMRYVVAALAMGLAGAVPLIALGAPAAHTPQQIIAHHFSMFAAGNLDAVLSDYSDNATVITAAGVIHGKAAIRQQFARLVRPRAGAQTAGAPSGPVIKQQFYTPGAAWLMWVQNEGKANEVRGVETYIIHNGKIDMETVGTVNMHAAPAAQ